MDNQAIVTAERLRDMGACRGGRIDFDRAFGRAVDISDPATQGVIVRAFRKVDLDWAIVRFVPNDCWDDYIAYRHASLDAYYDALHIGVKKRYPKNDAYPSIVEARAFFHHRLRVFRYAVKLYLGTEPAKPWTATQRETDYVTY